MKTTAKEKPMSRAELMRRLKAAGPYDSDDQRNKIACSLIGHSRIITACFGYIYCARCEAQIADALGGYFNGKDAVIVGHNCKDCKANMKKMTWRDRLFCPANPLKPPKGGK